jgi:glucosamine--fructose-6-phosphate aminotransferase (isomerizing)
MCGIVGGASERLIAPVLLDGLSRLEYRGYDSMGMALMERTGRIWSRRSVGRIGALTRKIGNDAIESGTGIAHTRWATHGKPSEENAHPQISRASLAVVHNGIIENHKTLRVELESKGFVFSSDTDTEVIAHLVQSFLEEGDNLKSAIRKAMAKMIGSYAIGVLSKEDPGVLVAAKHGSPLVIGHGDDGHYIASDICALADKMKRFSYLEDGDIALLSSEEIRIYDSSDGIIVREISIIEHDQSVVLLDQHAHYMHLEIHQQPTALMSTFSSLNDSSTSSLHRMAEQIFPRVEAIKIVACGTSYHAALVSKYWIEMLAGLQCDVEVASEYRHRKPVVREGSLFMTISQSGETADTLAALAMAKEMGYIDTVSISNVPTSSLARLSNIKMTTRAGNEIGVASTKGFTTQLMALLLFTLKLAATRGTVDKVYLDQVMSDLSRIYQLANEILRKEHVLMSWGKKIAESNHAIFLGRGAMYPIALEGALKLKETSYMPVDAYPSGELKHGPLALVDENMPVVALLPANQLSQKMNSNLQEVAARGGRLFIVADERVGIDDADSARVLRMPVMDDLIAPILYSIPVQLLAYHAALALGTDIDKPRNLAKSVTVE